MLSAAAAIEADARRSPTPESRRALSVAHLILGDLDQGVEGLRSLTTATPADAGVWSDLAAAYLTRAQEAERPADWPRALETALRALELSRHSPEALFNHALALEGMHLHEEARRAWSEARANERDATWLAEIEGESRPFEPETRIDREGFLDRLSQAVDRGDMQEVETLALESSEGVRYWFNSRGVSAAFDPHGRKTLALLVPVLTRSLKDPDIPDSIEQILGLPPDAWPSLSLFSEIATLHESNRWGEAEGRLSRLRGGKRLPLNLGRWRDLWQAVTDQQHGETARACGRIEALVAVIKETEQPFLKARAHYLRSVIASSSGQPDLAIRHRTEAARLFALAGETSWVAFARQQIGEVHGKLGLTEVDWDARLETLRQVPRFFNPRSALLSLTIVGDDLVRSELPRAAAAVYRAAHERAVAARLLDSAADTSLGIALALRTIDPVSARSAALIASQISSRIEDPVLRARMSGESLRVRASLEPENEVLVNEALRWLGNRGSWGRQIPLMTAHGLALSSSGRIEPAKAALQRATALYERNRPGDPELSDAGSDQIRPAYAALAEMEAQGGDPNTLSELARRYWIAASNVRLQIAPTSSPTSCSLAFVPTAHSVLSWFTCGTITRFHRVSMEAKQRRDLVSALVAARRAGLPGEAEARRLSDLLLSPWEADLGQAEELSLTVADDLARLPFAALPLRSGPLGARAALTYSPIPNAAPAPSRLERWRSPLVVTAAPDGPEFPRLPNAWAESSALSGKVGGRFLHHGRATTENTLALLPRSDLFYFSGHAIVNSSRPFDSSLVLVDSSNRPSFLTVRRVLSMDLRGLKLAVLAGCSTAEAGDVGSISLASAFLAAGARSVVGTLWPVQDDSMSRLMPRFFDYLLSEGSPARALARLRNDRSLTDADRAGADALAVSELAQTESPLPSPTKH